MPRTLCTDAAPDGLTRFNQIKPSGFKSPEHSRRYLFLCSFSPPEAQPLLARALRVTATAAIEIKNLRAASSNGI
jgi:hypothetical protein